MRDVLIESWDALHSAVFENVWDPAIMRYRNNRVYRGMSDGQWALTPSLNRACPQDLSLEKILLRSFMKYGYTELQGCNSFWASSSACPRACWTGPIRPLWPRTLPPKILITMTATA